ncbi:MAG: chromosome segregation protein SMC [Oscillospiraceae bacterium]
MPRLYLRALEIQGFKSFPEKTCLTFEKEITAIVGPNGSGKSNISDALLWVMGEQRSKALRGGKMEDVIFGGTEKRSPLNFAQVSLILDNSTGLFDVDTPELTITRRYYRSGESEYYVNREQVRLKDVNSLLMDTGLGRDGYSVIGQGRIAEIVSAKSSDRREIFEEAAGISRFRYRKEEAERKLERTEENLLRVNDKIDELEMQVTPLQKQAETAKKYLVLRDEQRSLEISVWMETLDKLHAEAETVAAAYDQSRAALDKAQNELEELYSQTNNFSEKMRECDVEAEKLRETVSQRESAAAECDSAAAVLKANLEHNEETIARIRAEMAEQSDRAEGIRAQAEEQRARIGGIDTQLAEKRLGVRAVQRETEENASRADETQRGLAALIARENELGDALTKCVTTASMLSDRKRELAERAGTIDADIAAAEEKYDEISKSLHAAEKEYESAKERYDEVNNIISGHRMLMGGRESRVRELTERLNRITVDKRSTEGRVNMLAEMEKEYEGMGKAVKTVMRDASRGTLRGVHGPVASLLTVEDKYALAIETALGGAMQNIVVDTQNDGKAAIEMLKRSDGGRATFLPLDTIRPNTLRRIPDDEGCLGLASRLVRYDPRYENIFANLLGRTVVAETLGDAVRLSRKAENQLRIVTLDGQMINAGGSMTGGSTARNVGILSRANELKKLRAQLTKLAGEEKDVSVALAEAERELAAARYEMEVASQELTGAAEALHSCESSVKQYKLLRGAVDENLEGLDSEKNSLAGRIREIGEQAAGCAREKEETESALTEARTEIEALTRGREDFEKRREDFAQRLSALNAEIASLTAEREATVRSAASLQELIDALSGDSETRQAMIDEALLRSRDIQAEIENAEDRAKAIRAQIGESRERIAAVNELKLSLEGRRTRCDREIQSKNKEILDLQSVCSCYEQKKLSAEMEESQIIDKLWENYELSRTAAQEQRRPVEDMAASSKRITELRREISRLGAVNVGAIEEYQRVSERYDFLTGQRDDVEKARRELLKIIADITGEMKEIFVREFNAINECFHTVFLELFGGGKAALELEDPEDPLGCGIEIRVQPPGKAVTTISLLSGGEKSFVAIALYFAIMKVRPTPFCVMDEIDAALDEANVERYADYMRSMADKTQFIVITHHRATMEEADVLYGVTMQEKGVTTVLSVDLEEAERSIS